MRLLSDLCRSLTAVSVGVQVRDAIPSLTVNADPAAPPGVGAYVPVRQGARLVEVISPVELRKAIMAADGWPWPRPCLPR
jgi:hypothetical protein